MRRLLVLTLFLLGCGRPATEAGTKMVAVGLDPGMVQEVGEPKGGVIDLVQLDLAGRNLDLGVTGFFGSTGAFDDAESDPTRMVLGFSYIFTPALAAASSLELISPVAPPVSGTCVPVINQNGPLGSFTTVDLGEAMNLRIPADEEVPGDKGMEFKLLRTPQDYPPELSTSFVYYIGTAPLIQDHPYFPDNWRFGESAELSFRGGVPPTDAPIAAIPRPSSAPDERVGKQAGDISLWLPEAISNLTVAGGTEGVPGREVVLGFEPEDLPGPFSGNVKGMHLTWDAPDDPSRTVVSLAIRLLAEDSTGSGLTDATGDAMVGCEQEVDVDPADYALGLDDVDFLRDHADAKQSWCDPDYEPFEELDGRHYRTRECKQKGEGQPLCYDVGGDRDPAGLLGTLLCSVPDTGSFDLPMDALNHLMDTVDGKMGGALMVFARTFERPGVKIPGVRDRFGSFSDINPIRVRTSQMVIARLEYSSSAGN